MKRNMWKIWAEIFFICKTMDKREFRLLLKHFVLMGKNTIEAKHWLDKHYGDSAPGKSTIIDGYGEYKRGEINPIAAERFDRSKSAVVPGNIQKTRVKEDQKQPLLLKKCIKLC